MNKMRRALLLLPVCALGVGGFAQQVAQRTQFVFDHFTINPAVAGSKDCLDIHLGYRKQWVGFAGAPTTAWATVHGTIRPKNKPHLANRHGIGAWVEADDAGPLGYTTFSLAYAYHLQMAKDRFLSLGFFGGIKQQKLDAGEITLTDFDDPAITGSVSVMVLPNITPGIWYYDKTSFLGMSIHQLLGNPIERIGTDSRLWRQYMLSGGKRFRISKITTVMPAALMKISPGSPMALDVNVMMEWKRMFGVGASYRNSDAVAVMMRLSFLKYFQLGYSYDITTSRIKLDSSNTHEFILAITPCPPKDPSKMIVRCPVFE